MKLSTRMHALTAATLSGLVLVCGLALWQSRLSQADNEHAYQAETLATRHLADANSALWALRWGVAQYIGLVDRAQRQKLLEADSQRYADFERHMRSFVDLPIFAATRSASADVMERFTRYASVRRHWLELMESGKSEEAAQLRTGELTPAGAATVASIEALIEMQKNEAEAAYKARNAALDRHAAWMLAGCLTIIAVAGFVSVWLTRSLLRQLGGEPETAASLARSVAQGDLDVHLKVSQGDSTSLMAQLRTMRDALVELVSHVRQNAEAVAAASAQIAQGNSDLSGRTEEQASALQQTAASMEQLGTTVKQNSDNAQRANQLALDSSSLVTRGGEVVGQVVDTMKDINESSKKIADIIGVIDGIAFQTNILALNAAVEAARAGEQGRGFAVVAGEVGNLARRSAEAAQQIKSLISASVVRVEQGAALVDQAGATMAEIVSSIRQVTRIIGDISVASREQSAGVAQVSEAVGRMDRNTQQNAAVVEQSAAAAEGLKQQAQRLVRAVAAFKLGYGAAAAR